MMNLEILLAARRAYEQAFNSLNGSGLVEQRLSDRELELTGHVFVARKDDKVIQITVEEGAVSTAFIKSVGVDDEHTLLQIIVDQDDLRIDSCKSMLLMWADEHVSLNDANDLISRF